jgi:ribosome-binding factor A
MGSDEQIKNSWAGLQAALGFIRREIGHRIRLRCTPEISFHLDKSLDYSVHIQELLAKIKSEDEAH